MKLGKTQNMRAGYNMRIWRPGIWNLNPYFNNLNPMFITQGNSNLKSEKAMRSTCLIAILVRSSISMCRCAILSTITVLRI